MSWNNGEPVEDMSHLIVAQRRTYANHYIPENRRFFHWSQSEDVRSKQLRERIHNMIHSMKKPGPLLVFHDNHEDLKYLSSPEIDAPLEEQSFLLSESSRRPKCPTCELFAALEGDSDSPLDSDSDSGGLGGIEWIEQEIP